MNANDKIYQEYYDKLKTNDVFNLVKQAVNKFDFKGYWEYRHKKGYDLVESFDMHQKFTQDFIFELMSSSYNYGHSGHSTYSGHLSCYLTKNICELRYGEFGITGGDKEIDIRHSIKIDNRQNKLERILNKYS